MKHLGVIAIFFGVLSLGVCGVFSLWVLERHERELAITENAQSVSRNPTGNGQVELVQGQRDKLNLARTLRLGSGIAGGVLVLAGVGLLRRRRLA